MRKGRILKGIGGFYYVETSDGLIECKARGIFRNEKIKPCVGDLVEITVDNKGIGIIEAINPRASQLIRPPVANITQMVVVSAIVEPKLNFSLLNRIILNGEYNNLRIVACFNKKDLISDLQRQNIINLFRNTGYKTIFTSVKNGDGIEDLKRELDGHISVFCGPSGVGKSSLIKAILPHRSEDLEIGSLSGKVKRGKHTTRHVELFKTGINGYLADTPGFGNIDLSNIDQYDLEELFPEFVDLRQDCRFKGCLHINEPECKVKAEVGIKVSSERYSFYKEAHIELLNKR